MGGYLLVFGAAALTTYFATFAVRALAPRIGTIVKPSDHHIHNEPMPSSGGIAMLIGFLVAMGLTTLLPQFDSVFRGSSMPLGVCLGAAVICVVGYIDDTRDVSPPAKVAGQVLAGSIMAHFGVTMLYFRIPWVGSFLLSPDLAAFVTVVWIVVIANAVNLIDGLDGLAAGIVAIASIAFFVYGDKRFAEGLLDGPSTLGPLVAAITAGICVGFLPHNFNPARIFMGDAGSMLLGLLLACAAIILSGQSDDQFSGRSFFFFAPIFIPFVILGVPVLDTSLAILRRARKGVGISSPDREHLHHRLMELGHGPRRSVVILWMWTAVLSASVLVPTLTNRGGAFVPLAIIVSGVLLYTYFAPGKSSAVEGEDNPESFEPQSAKSFSDSEDRMSSPL